MQSSAPLSSDLGELPVPNRTIGWLLTLAGVIALVFLCVNSWGERLQDDAYISFVYSRNFAQGHGFVYFPMVKPTDFPVEGYSNFLWTALFGLVMKGGVDDPGHIAQVLGTVFGCLCVVLTYLISRRLGASPLLGGIAAVLIAFEPTLTEEALGGLETTFYATLILAALLLYLRRPRTKRHGLVGSGLLGVAALTRPETPFFFGMLELRELFLAIKEGRSFGTWIKESAPRWLPFLILVLGHLAWRVGFYGEWLPNTYYAKTTHSALAWNNGVDYVLQGIGYSGVFLFLLPFWMLRRMEQGGAFLTILAALFALYVLQAGGDFKLSFRYLMVPILLWGALGAAAVESLGRTLHEHDPRIKRWLAPVLLAVMGTTHLINEHLYKETNTFQAQRHQHLKAAGELLDQQLPIDATIAVSNAGRIPFFSGRRTIDMLGLNDHHIARQPVKALAAEALVGHERGDGKYVLGLKPDVILFVNTCILPQRLGDMPGHRSILQREAFSTSEKELVSNYQMFNAYHLKSAKLPGVNMTGPDGTEFPVYLNWWQRVSQQ